MAEPALLDGIWEMVRAELGGDEAPELVIRNTEFVLQAGTYAVRFRGEVADRGSFELGATLDAKTILLRGTEGTNLGRTIPGIYQLVGDRLRVCYGLDGVAPTRFATVEGDARYLATYRRKLNGSPSPRS